MKHAVIEQTWMERLQHDETLQAFVYAEIARAGIEVNTLRHQNQYLRQNVATLSQQLDAARAEVRALRRRAGRGARLDEDHDAVA